MSQAKELNNFLDKNGWGQMTAELREIFLSHGCDPACHICEKVIPFGANFHLKPFVVIEREPEGQMKRLNYRGEKDEDWISKTTTTVQVMLCQPCSARGCKLPAHQAEVALDLANQIKPRKYPPGEVAYTERPHYGGCFLVTRNGQPEIVANQEAVNESR